MKKSILFSVFSLTLLLSSCSSSKMKSSQETTKTLKRDKNSEKGYLF
jgi:PBP1b-binding outer membrane lipoprotein LpoB